jgi:hypothetical protein
MKKLPFLILSSLLLVSAPFVRAEKIQLGDITDDTTPPPKPKQVDPTEPQLKMRTYKPPSAPLSSQSERRGATEGRPPKAAPKPIPPSPKVSEPNKPQPAKVVKPAPVKKVVAEKKPEESAEEKKKKAEAVYLEALKAAQANDFNKAFDLCQETLQINPRHLQAQKMAERLGSRHIP